MKTLITLGLVSLTALAAPALAVPGPAQAPETRAAAQAQAEAHFARFDTDRNGAVTKAEFDAAKTALKAERAEKRGERQAERFAKLDADKNGQLSKAEWDAAAAQRGEGKGDRGKGMHRGHGGHRMAMRDGGRWFDRLDANKDGQVTKAEAVNAKLAMFDKADANKDGTVTPEERKAAWGAMRAERKAKG